jgi:hypothetical protein
MRWALIVFSFVIFFESKIDNDIDRNGYVVSNIETKIGSIYQKSILIIKT